MAHLRVHSYSSAFLFAHLLAWVACLCGASSDLASARQASLRAGSDPSMLDKLSDAMGEALGCGGHVGPERLDAIEQALAPMWRAMPKSSEGRGDRRSLRYLVHRHFNRRYALHVRGFEPVGLANASGWSGTDILSQRVPAYVESVLESQHRLQRGFDLRDAALMVATLEQLIFDSESAVLERIYKDRARPTAASLSRQSLSEILEDYIVHWLMAGDEAGIQVLLANRTYLANVFPHWSQLVPFIQGELKAYDYKRQLTPHTAITDGTSRQGHNALVPQYSFEDAHRVVGGITKSFASFWVSECSSLKDQLVAMDKHHTGRVPLSRFYGTGLEAEWRFGESEAYLRELGALDESNWLGKQVIIPNYIQGTSNCIVTTPHYLVCCANECEGILAEIEESIGSPTAEPAELLAIVSGLSSQATLDDDFPPALGSSLRGQLEQIASVHDGRVPLHGRLFAQWLHYVFPRECVYPHRAGSVKAVAPLEFGKAFVATVDEMQEHASTVNISDIAASMQKDELHWMSQWSAEEELVSDYALRRWAPWEERPLAWVGASLLLLAGLTRIVRRSRASDSKSATLLPTHGKSHYV